MTSVLENKYVEPDLRHIELSKFDIRKEKEEYHREQLDIEEAESDKFTSLVESIRDMGILQPVYVIESDDKSSYEVVDGGRRLRAAKFLKLPSVPAMVFPGGAKSNETEIRKRALIANIARKDLTLEEKGEGLVQYYKSGGVDPARAISYLNTLRQRRQTRNGGVSGLDQQQDQKEVGGSNNEFGMSDKPNSKGRPKLKTIDNPEEYARFLELHKKLGISRMTQYAWMSQVIFIVPEIRKSKEYKSLTSKDQRYVTASKVRNKPDMQKQMVNDLAKIEKEYEEAKQKRKKDDVGWTLEAAQIKEKKKEKLKMYLPNTADKKPKQPLNPYHYYGQINGYLSKVWTALTMSKNMPRPTDDIINDFLKPTRQEFKEFINNLGGDERIQLNEWLSYVQQALEDRRKLFGQSL